MAPADLPDRTNATSFLLWDLAGTLVPYDPVSGRPLPLPGCDVYLPELARDFRMVVTTGDGAASARAFLAGCDILPHMEQVYGDLARPVGKPYGEILRDLGGNPGTSLAIGDRLRTDIPADTGEVVTLLINQAGDVGNAGMIAFMTHILRKQSGTFPQAFRLLTAAAARDPDREGPTGGGTVVRAWKRNDGIEYGLWEFEHHALAGTRLIIVL